MTRALIDRRSIARATHGRLTRAIRLESATRPISARDYSRFLPGSCRKNSLIGISVDDDGRLTQDTRRPVRRLPGIRRVYVGSGFLCGFLRAVPRLTTPETL